MQHNGNLLEKQNPQKNITYCYLVFGGLVISLGLSSDFIRTIVFATGHVKFVFISIGILGICYGLCKVLRRDVSIFFTIRVLIISSFQWIKKLSLSGDKTITVFNKYTIKRNKTSRFLLSLFLLIICLISSIKMQPFASDDAYIHFRIAENFSTFFFPYYNLSEPVMSTSSFVWTSFLAILALLKLPLPVTVAIINPVLTVLGSLVWTSILSKNNQDRVNSIFIMWFQIIYVGFLLPTEISFMETPFVMLLVGIAILLISKEKYWGWIIIALAIFTRYEIVVYAALFCVYFLLSKRFWKQKGFGMLYFIVTCVLISLILLGFYSTILPNTLFAKNIVYQLKTIDTFNTVFYSIFPNPPYPLLGIFPSGGIIQSNFYELFSKLWVPAIITLIVVAIFLYPYKNKQTRTDNIGLVLLIGGGLLSTLYVVQKTFVFEWYMPLYSIPIAFGVYYYAEKITTFFLNKEYVETTQKKNKYQVIPIVLLAVIITINPLASLIQNTYAAIYDMSKNSSAATGMRVQRYMEVGRILYTLYPDARLLTSEIGGLGYSFHGEIIDGIGLITPRALVYHPMSVPEQRENGAIGAIPAAMIDNEMPELIVSYPGFIKEFDSSVGVNKYYKITVPPFSKSWQTKTGIESVYGNYELFIYIREDIVKPQDVKEIIDYLTFD